MGNGDWLSHLSDESQLKYEKIPLSHQKMKNSFLYYIELLMIGQQKSTKMQKRPPKSSKMKYLFLNHVQPLVIGQAIQAMKVN